MQTLHAPSAPPSSASPSMAKLTRCLPYHHHIYVSVAFSSTRIFFTFLFLACMSGGACLGSCASSSELRSSTTCLRFRLIKSHVRGLLINLSSTRHHRTLESAQVQLAKVQHGDLWPYETLLEGSVISILFPTRLPPSFPPCELLLNRARLQEAVQPTIGNDTQ